MDYQIYRFQMLTIDCMFQTSGLGKWVGKVGWKSGGWESGLGKWVGKVGWEFASFPSYTDRT